MTRRKRRHRASQRGFVLADVIGGIALLAAVASLLAVSVHRYHAASDRLADSRDAMRLAEDALARLQTNQPPPADAAEQSVSVKSLDAAAPSNHRWVEVTAKVHRRVATLTGLVPASEKTP